MYDDTKCNDVEKLSRDVTLPTNSLSTITEYMSDVSIRAINFTGHAGREQGVSRQIRKHHDQGYGTRQIQVWCYRQRGQWPRML